MGKIWEWFFGKEGDTTGHTNSRTKKTDPQSLEMPERKRDPDTGRFVSAPRKRPVRR